MLLNTGTDIVQSKSGLLTTVGWKLGDEPAVYCLEGAIAITGALVQWLRDNLGMISTSEEVEELAATVEDNGGIYFVPAFSGLFAPYWRGDARGVIVGLTRYVNKGHFARAALEATAWQTREVLDAMEADSGVKLKELKVDGGMVYNDLLMQFQADCLQVPVIRPKVAETTALGAAYAAGLAVGFWSSNDDLRQNWGKDEEWTPQMAADEVASRVRPLEEGRHPHLRLGRVRRSASDGRRARSTRRRTMTEDARARRARGVVRRGSRRSTTRTKTRHGDFAEGQEQDHHEPDEVHEGDVRRGAGGRGRTARHAANAATSPEGRSAEDED